MPQQHPRYLQWIQPAWQRDQQPDPRHFSRRRFTAHYISRKCLVRNLWIIAGLLMLAMPNLSLLICVALLTTFVSFMLLDEQPD